MTDEERAEFGAWLSAWLASGLAAATETELLLTRRHQLLIELLAMDPLTMHVSLDDLHLGLIGVDRELARRRDARQERAA